MSYLIENKVSYIHIPKNAGTSISKLIQENYKYLYSGKQHDTWFDMPKFWKKNSFLVIRNPFDRIVSMFEHDKRTFLSKRKGHPNIEWAYQECLKGFNHWICNHQLTKFSKNNSGAPRKFSWTKQTQLKFFPQEELNKTIQVVRYENLHQDLKKVFEKNNIKIFPFVFYSNASSRNRNYKDYYNDDSKKIVTKLFEKELDLFDYSF